MNDKMLTIVIAMYAILIIGGTIAAWELLCYIAQHLTITIGWL